MSRSRTPDEERAWQTVRRVVLTRDGQRCRECGELASRRELDVHHLIPRSAGGRDEASNCITLCDGCHARRHLNLQVSLSRRMMERWALRLARWLDTARELPHETAGLQAGLRLFGVERFREGQLDAVLAALRGESVLVIRPTGGGKSLCFQLPAVLKGQPATVVLSPLKALMVNQVDGLHKRRLPATFINGDLSPQEKKKRYELLDAGALSFLYVAPERFNPERVRTQEIERLAALAPSFLVVDEAHLVDRWGDDFRTDYSRIADIRRTLGNPPVLAFTATAGAATQQRIKSSLGIPDARTLVSGVDRPNIALIRIAESSDQKRARIVGALIDNLASGRLMLFVPTTNVGRKVQEAMAAAGHNLPLYHAKLRPHERENLLGRFTGAHEPPLNAVICTSAFSMGLDVADVRVVVNWQHPSAVEDYLQEFGRAGRDGEPALAVLFTNRGEEAGLLRWMAERTAEQVVADGKRTDEQARQTLKGKLARIAEMNALASEQGQCFRVALNQALTGPAPSQRRSLAMRLLDWVFGRRAHIRAADGCCDICDPALAERVRAGPYAPTARPVSGSRATERTVPRTARRGAAAAGLAIVVGVLASFGLGALGGDEVDAVAVAEDTFVQYTGAFANQGEFGSVSIRERNDEHLACADHERGKVNAGDYMLCLLIDVDRDVGARVIGGYKAEDDRRFECYGVARERAICRQPATD